MAHSSGFPANNTNYERKIKLQCIDLLQPLVQLLFILFDGTLLKIVFYFVLLIFFSFKEMAWVGKLLVAFVQRLDHCNCDGMRCLAPTQTVLFLMGQHAPDQLTEIVSVIEMLKYSYFIDNQLATVLFS